MAIFRKILAGLILFIAVPLAMSASLIIALSNTYLDPDFYRSDEFQETVYNLLIDKAAEEFSSNIIIEEFFTPEEVETELKNTIPPEMIGSAIDDLVDQLTEVPFPEEVILSTHDIKSEIPNAFKNLVNDLDDPLISTYLDESVGDYIPNEIAIPIPMDEDQRSAISILIKTQHNMVSWLAGFVIALFFIMGLLVWKPLHSIAAWEGWALFSAGTPILAMGVVLLNAFNAGRWMIDAVDPETLAALFRPFIDQLLWMGGGMTGGGILMFILYFILKARCPSKS